MQTDTLNRWGVHDPFDFVWQDFIGSEGDNDYLREGLASGLQKRRKVR